MIDLLGYIGGFLFAFCGLPQAWKSYKDGNSDGISMSMILMWLSGEILMQIYVFLQHGLDLPLLINYWINTFFVAIILYYKLYKRSDEDLES